MNENDTRVALFTNISSEPFAHPFGGALQSFEAGESRMLPYYLADHLATHLARSIFLKNDKSARNYDPKDPTGGHGAVLWSDDDIDQMKAKIITNVYAEERAKPKTELELMQEQIDRLNQVILNQQPTVPAPAESTAPADDTIPEVPGDSEPEADPVVTEPQVPEDGPSEPPLPSATVYKDKAEVIAELQKRNISFNARASKSTLEQLLK